jgi:hypothetical protein
MTDKYRRVTAFVAALTGEEGPEDGASFVSPAAYHFLAGALDGQVPYAYMLGYRKIPDVYIRPTLTRFRGYLATLVADLDSYLEEKDGSD